MGRPVLVVVCVVVAAGAAASAPPKEVQIETSPNGATVYLNDKEDGPACKPTPCSVKVPVGETTVIIEMAGHKPKFDTINVPSKPKKELKFSFTLETATGAVTLKGPAGASVRMDDIDQGKVPASVEAPAGEHTFVWFVGNKQIYSKKITVGDGEEIELSAPSKAVADKDKDKDKDRDKVATTDAKRPEVAEKSPEGSSGGGEIGDKGPAPEGKRSNPVIAFGVAFDVGFRQFAYQNASQDADETEDGNMRAGPIIELYPTTLLGFDALGGLAIVARFEQGLNKQEVTFVEGGDNVGAKTVWQSFEVSLRQRWHIGDSATVDVGAGFVRDRYGFEGELGNLPDTDYRVVRIGGGASLSFGALNPYLRGEERIVLGGTSGELPGRFSGGTSTANGVYGALGLAFKLGPADVHLEGAVTRYSWTFHPDMTVDPFTADGATDLIEHVQLIAGYVY